MYWCVVKSIVICVILLLPLIVEDINILVEFNWMILNIHMMSISSAKNDMKILKDNWGQFCLLRMFFVEYAEGL